MCAIATDKINPSDYRIIDAVTDRILSGTVSESLVRASAASETETVLAYETSGAWHWCSTKDAARYRARCVRIEAI